MIKSQPARDSLLARTMVIEHREAWRWAARAGSSMPLLLVPDFDELDSGEARAYAGPCVIPLDPEDAAVGDQGICLPPLEPEPLACALVDADLAELEAQARAHASGGKLSALQRLYGYERRPRWADEPGPRAPFMAMLLAGRWGAGSEADRQAVGGLGCDAGTVESWCTRLAIRGDAPVEQVDGVWQWCAPADAWNVLARELTASQLERFREVAIRVLSEDDPRYDMPARERIVAPVHGKVLAHSSALRQGLAESLVRLVQHNETLRPTHGYSIGSALAVRVVEEILAPAWQRWASLSELLPILAKAAPQAFLKALESSLALGDEGVGHLPAEEVDAFSGHTPHVGLLWALEMLGRSQEHVSLVGDLLAELAALDPGGPWPIVRRPACSISCIPGRPGRPPMCAGACASSRAS